MKIRTDFVTNSSSSSFIIAKKGLDNDQIEAIKRHGELGKKLGLDYSKEEWEIHENEYYIKGRTSMDNFDMGEFLNLIGVPSRIIVWSEWFYDDDDLDLPEDDSSGGMNWRELLHEITD